MLCFIAIKFEPFCDSNCVFIHITWRRLTGVSYDGRPQQNVLNL